MPVLPLPPADQLRTAGRTASRARRVQRVMQRWGLPGLALLGPIGLGTQLSAVLAISMGVSAWRTLAWIAAGTTAWCVVAAVLADAGMSFAGVGA